MGELLEANRALAAADANLERRLDHYRTLAAPGGTASHQAFLARRAQQDGAAAAVVSAGTARLHAEAEVAQARDVWAAAAARVRALERLDERRREEHTIEVLREETVLLDEIATSARLTGVRS